MAKKVKVAGASYEEGSEEHIAALVADIKDGLEQARKIVTAHEEDNRNLMALALTYESAFMMIQEIVDSTGNLDNIRTVATGALSLRGKFVGHQGRGH